ncbi:uncharacterized protein LOC123956422 isoform X2 [Micropterus dolomieu]|uniref:uncharacterized protein LOC123956422 isoform X2 n=1 Tax=Micropterus dolomieu TaxID=147949 RepID=UPI001E8DA46D|nr:uncharacterized protein LOC123956422 isoform X2 [Micropterus dolomieu]
MTPLMPQPAGSCLHSSSPIPVPTFHPSHMMTSKMTCLQDHIQVYNLPSRGFPAPALNPFQGLSPEDTTDSARQLLKDLPLHTMEELDRAEATLQSQEAKKTVVSHFAIIGGTTLEVRVRRMLSCALTNELASGLNWAGKKLKDQTKQKKAFKEMVLCRCMFDALTQQIGAGATEFAFAQVVQKWLRYPPDRMGGAGRQTPEQE